MEMTQMYQQKYENFQKALNRQEPNYVPTIINNSGGGFFWSDKTLHDVAGDHMAYAKALTAFMDEMWVDVNALSGLTTTPRVTDAFPTAENRITPSGVLTHIQDPYMKPEEYDQLIADPKAYIANVLLPRKFPYIFEDRDVAKSLLRVYAEEQVDNLVIQTGFTNKYIAETYGVSSCVNLSCTLNTPLDHLFDFFRGFQGTLTDLRRYSDKIQAAIDAIWNYRSAEMISKPYDASKGFPFQPAHIPAYLSPKQFKELYWPYEKKLIEWVAASGSKIFLILEGHWENLLDCFYDVPKDSLVLSVDDDDLLKVYEKLGDYQILVGGVKIADTRLKKFDDIEGDIKKIIDTCAPGGGFLFGSDKAFLTPGDVNSTLIQCYNLAHEYSSK